MTGWTSRCTARRCSKSDLTLARARARDFFAGCDLTNILAASTLLPVEILQGVALPPFDPLKDSENLKSHGLSLAFGRRVVADRHSVESLDDRFDYGEGRWNALGMVDGIVYVATYTDRDDGVRFISVRPATKRETDRYFQTRDG